MRISGSDHAARPDPVVGASTSTSHRARSAGSSCRPSSRRTVTTTSSEVVHRLERAEVLPHSRRRRRGVEAAERALHDHPVEDDPDLADRLKAAAQAERVSREVDELRQRMRGRSQSISRDFDRVLRILDSWGYVDGWSLTDAGQILARTFHECDLLIVECLRQGLLRRPRAGGARRPGVGVRVRAPQPPSRRRRLVPVAGGASERWQRDRRDQRRAAGDRGGGRPGGAPRARPDVHRRRVRVGRGRGLRRGGRGRGAVRRRLRAHDQAADRRAPPAGARRPQPRHAAVRRAGSGAPVPRRRRRVERRRSRSRT